ncbi:unnamed protein product [Caenorhabditis angaria]|uniref:glucuronosyltransferase n=1 Tax=Caenorhabditis angaria TaxID=860376 RepID=A0A9P1IYF6_9PELO|nr:unnamed protein product [Caenorhabditis angaria]
MPDSYKSALLDTFSKFAENVTFIWKYEADDILRNATTKNVIFEKWVPQRALLMDPRLTAFFTHAGLGSVNEVSYSGKPAILCPIFADQMRNAKMLARHQGAIEFSKFDLNNAEKLEKSIHQILFDEKFAENSRNLARRLENQPIKPAELLVRHCEFAAEFGELPSLDPYSRQMSFFTFFMIDQLLIFTVMFGAIFGVFVAVLKFIARRYTCNYYFGCFVHYFVMSMTFVIMGYCGFSTYFTIRAHRGASTRTRQLQNQLFQALVLQTVIPSIFMYIPTGIMFIFPFLDIDLKDNANFIVVCSFLYPGIDPLITIFIIRDFRLTVSNIVKGRGGGAGSSFGSSIGPSGARTANYLTGTSTSGHFVKS